jgi:hypothetical protein
MLDEKRGSEFARFATDIVQLKKRVMMYENHVKKLKGFVDEDEPSMLIDELQIDESREFNIIGMKEALRLLEMDIKRSRAR